MRVLIHLKAFYDQAAVPDDVAVTPADIKSGKVKPGKFGGYTARVTRQMETHSTVTIDERSLIQRLVFELIPRPGLRKMGPCNRRQLVAELLDGNVLPEVAHPKHITSFEVESDQGPDEALCRSTLALYTDAQHHLTGEPLIDPADVEAIVAKYMEPATHQDHVDHLHARFGVAKKAS
jgi:hypothetical protein